MQIPDFPEMTELQLEHKPLLDNLFRLLQPQQSELSFTNLYIWRHAYGTHLGRLDDTVCIFSLRPDPEDSFLLPLLGDGTDADKVKQCFGWMQENEHAPRLCRATVDDLQRMGITEAEFDIIPDRDNWDYVYQVEDLSVLDPDVYPDKARHVEKFTKRFRFEYHRITPDLVPACEALQDLWCDEKHCDMYSSLRAEARAVKEVLENLEALDVTGGAILVNGRVQAFTLGEKLNGDTVVCHIEKASPDLHGAFQVINQQFLLKEWQMFPFVNREQDVGDPGLRKAKESYLPYKMVEKFTVKMR